MFLPAPPIALPSFLLSPLQSFPPVRTKAMLQTVQSIASRMFYRSAMEITAKQMQARNGAPPPWAQALQSLPGDDAFDTVMQVCWGHAGALLSSMVQ